jgi:hypothetical protein
VDDPVVCIALERGVRVFPVHPAIERIVHEQVGQQGRDRRALWGSLLSCDEGAVWHLHRGFQPPFDVEQQPALVGVVSHRFEQQIMGHAVEEGPNVEIDHPVLLPAAPTGHGQCVMGASPRSIAVAVGVEDRLQLLF